tara:strand:+ start:465 stop:1109 length:645 start_codon:yes stop_codon:yes gene_type:complete
MDEEINIIDKNTRNEKIKIFISKNKKFIISGIVFLFLIILFFYSYKIYTEKKRNLISENYNNAILEYKNKNDFKAVVLMKDIINQKDSTYSPLALYFIIDNNLIENRDKINQLFDIVINKTSLEDEIKNLIIYKKALFNADFLNESELLKILNPVVNSESVWRSHALYLLAEYFYSKNEKQKSKEFYNQIINIKNANQDIVREARKRLNRDLSE